MPPLVLVVAYGKPDLLALCLAPLAGLTVVVVDNSLSDEVRAVAEAAGATYLRSPANIGFGSAVNLGIQAFWDGTGDVLLLNPDAVLPAAGVLVVQVALHASSRTGMASPSLAGPDGPQRASWPLPSPAQVWADACGISLQRRVFLTGAVLMLRGDALADVGLFDERYFLYSEETDWQKRALLRGWEPVVAAAVTAQHVGGATGTSANTLHWSQVSTEIYMRKWFGPAGWQVARAGSAVARARRRLR